MIRLLRRLDACLLNLLAPDGASCLSCGRLTHGRRLCAECAEALAHSRLTSSISMDDLPSMPGNVSIHAVWHHEGVAQRLVLLLKQSGVHSAAEVLADGLADVARMLDLPDNTVVSWVPMPEARLHERGTDHARRLAEATASRLCVSCAPLLVRVGEQANQRGLNREARLQNLRGAFTSCGELPRTILLIDDVLTTGATAKACCDCLTNADRVIVLTATRTRR